MKKFQFRSYVEKNQVENVLEQAKFRSAGISILFAINSLMYAFYYTLARETADILPTAEAETFANILLIYAVASAVIAIGGYIVGMIVLKPHQEEISNLEKQVKTIEVIEVAQIAKDSKYHKAQTMLFSILVLILLASILTLRIW